MINWRLKRLIIERYRTQAVFSLKMRRPQSYVSEIVRGRRRLSDEEKGSWAKALDVDASLIDSDDKTVPVSARHLPGTNPENEG